MKTETTIDAAGTSPQPEPITHRPKAGRTWTDQQKADLAVKLKARWAEKRAALTAPAETQLDNNNVAPQPQAELASPPSEGNDHAVTDQVRAEMVTEPAMPATSMAAPLPTEDAPTNAAVISISTDGTSTPESGQIAQIPSPSFALTDLPCETVESMTDERLDRYIVGHFSGLKKNLWALAEGLTEKKKRLVRKGCEGKWSGYVKYEVGMSVSWADRLVRNYSRYLQLGVRVRKAAEQARVNIMKPAVIALLQSYNAEFLSTGEPSEDRFATCVQALQEAGKRKPNSDCPPNESETEPGAGDSGIEDWDDSDEEPGDEGKRSGKSNGAGSNGKTVRLPFTSQQAEELDELIEDLKELMGTQDRPNIVLHSLRLVRELKLARKTPKV